MVLFFWTTPLHPSHEIITDLKEPELRTLLSWHCFALSLWQGINYHLETPGIKVVVILTN